MEVDLIQVVGMTSASKSSKPGDGASKFKKWYENPKNRKALSDRRRKRYQTDPEYRESLLAAKRVKHVDEKGNPLPDGFYHKTVNGKDVIVARIKDVASMLDVPASTIRGWEQRGWIPAPSIPGVHRFYTRKQVELLKKFAGWRDGDREVATAYIFSRW